MWVITIVILLIAPLTTTHEPPSISNRTVTSQEYEEAVLQKLQKSQVLISPSSLHDHDII